MTTASIDQLRRSPRQARSRDRVEGFLDAGDALLAAEGSSALSTVRVAEAAGASIGTLYHWFPDKEAIAEALALRYWGELAEVVAGVADDIEAGLDEDPVDVVIDALAAGFRERPGFLALWYGDLRSEQIRDATRPTRGDVQGSIERILAVAHPDAAPALRATVARVVVLIGDGALREAFRLAHDGDPTVLSECRHALRVYVESRLGKRS
jgi:AcrR family transcriptional regulator